MINDNLLKKILTSPNRNDTSEEHFLYPLSAINIDKENNQDDIDRKYSIINKTEKNFFPDFLKESKTEHSFLDNIIKNIGEKKIKFKEINNITNYEKKYDDLSSVISQKIKNDQMPVFGDEVSLTYNTNLSNINMKNNECIFTPNDFNDFSASFFSSAINKGYNYFSDDITLTHIDNTTKKNQDIPGKFVIAKSRNYNKHKINIVQIDFDDKCFPFKSGKGIINMSSKPNKELLESFNSNLNKTTSTNASADNDFYLIKFNTKKYFINEKGKKRRIMKQRKYNPDIIRKRLKLKFHRTLKNIINTNMKNSGAKKLFDFLPQCFLINLTKKLNSKYFEHTYKEILLTDFALELDKTDEYKNIYIDKSSYLKNKEVIEYLESNPEISKKSGFDIVKNMKYKDILKRYFISNEFEDSLNELKKENETQEYIQYYIYYAKNYIGYYTNNDNSCEYNNNIVFNTKETKIEDDEDDGLESNEDYNKF